MKCMDKKVLMQVSYNLLPECLLITSFCVKNFYYSYCLCFITTGTFVIYEQFHANNISENDHCTN